MVYLLPLEFLGIDVKFTHWYLRLYTVIRMGPALLGTAWVPAADSTRPAAAAMLLKAAGFRK